MPSKTMEWFDKVVDELVVKHSLACEALTEQQLVAAIKQAIACGDFQRLVSVDGAQQVVYIPAAECERLKGKVKDLETRIRNIKEVLEGEFYDYI